MLLIVVGFVLQFWSTPKEGISEADFAAANVARMEASVAGKGSSKNKSEHPKSKFLEKLKSNQERQMKYLTILAMVLGVGFLAYSFMKKKVS